MKKGFQICLIVFVSLLVMSVMPGRDMVSAADNPEIGKISLTNNYNLKSAVMLNDDFYSIGSAANSNEVELTKKSSGHTEVIFPAGTLKPESEIVEVTKEHIIVANRGLDDDNSFEVLLVDRVTNEIDRISADDYFKPYFSILREQGFEPDEVDTTYIKPNSGGSPWVVFVKETDINPDGNEDPGFKAAVNLDGGLYLNPTYYNILGHDNDSLFFSQDGIFYEANEEDNSLSLMSSDGSTSTYQLPSELSNHEFLTILADGYSHIVLYAKDSDRDKAGQYYVLKFKEGNNSLKVVNQLKDDIYYNFATDEEGKIWFYRSNGQIGYLNGNQQVIERFQVEPSFIGVSEFSVHHNEVIIATWNQYGVSDVNLRPMSGWGKENGKWFYYIENGIHTGWIVYENNWYYLKEDGEMATGWVEWKNDWYFLEANGAMKTGWLKWNDNWYYMNRADGKMKTGWIELSPSEWYYLNSDGIMQTGWVKDQDKWYYLGYDGEMEVGWVYYKGKWYFLNSEMQTGWVRWKKAGDYSSKGEWYYLGKDGVMQTGWIKDQGKWYYLYENGQMAHDTTIQGYKLGSDGAWLQ
jgi:glucan-binding YG repeat protein